MEFFDTHCHLQDERIRHDIVGIIDRAIAAGVRGMLCCGSNENDWQSVLAIANQFPCVIPALGLHPWFIATRSPLWLSYLEELVRSRPNIVIGEIGLDHAIEVRDDVEQMKVFHAQVDLAKKLKRPVSMHCRRAWGDLLKYLHREKTLHNGMIIHSYSGPVDLVNELQSYQITLSFSGSITYLHNNRGRSSAMQVDPQRMVLETDSPDILPCGVSGHNEPSTLPQIAGALAKVRSTVLEEIAGVTTANSRALFGC